MSEGEGAATAAGPGQRFDQALYSVEQGLITGALLVMTFSYFLQIVHRELNAQLNAFDLMFLRWRGFDPQTAAPELIEFITTVQTPAVLSVLTFVMALLAVRTRLRSQSDGATVEWSLGRRLAVALGITVLCAAILQFIALVPARWTCLIVLVAILVPAARKGLAEGKVANLAGAGLGGLAVAAFFLTKVGDDYVWSVELASVLLMYVGFFGASMATREGRHIQVDAVRKKLSPMQLPLYNAICGVVTLLFCALLLVLAVQYVSDQLGHGGELQATGLPEFLVSLPIAVSLLVMIGRFFVRVRADFGAWRRGEAAEALEPGAH